MPVLINILPPELLSHIFVATFQSWQFARSVGDESYGQIHYPTVFSSVSAQWRRIAIGTPSLWSYIYLNYTRYAFESPEYVDLYLERSGSLPLSVCIGRYAEEYNLEFINEKLAALLQSLAMRLEYLAIACYKISHATNILSAVAAGGAVGRVRKLALYARPGGSAIVLGSLPSQESLRQLFQPLRTLYLEAVSFDWNTIACRNLVDLQILDISISSRPTLPQFVRFLNANPALRRLRLSDFDLRSYRESESQRITLLELRKVELDLNPYVMLAFLKLLDPVPQKLDLELCSCSVPHLEDQIADLLCQVFQQNQIVFLHITGERWFPFFRVLPHVPHLKTIKIQESCLIDCSLDETNDQRVLLSKLKNVELVGTHIYEAECLGVLLCLPSVERILLSYGDFGDQKNALKDIVQVREWLNRLGVTADIVDSSQSQWGFHPSPFM
ncbi:hypothetical protein BDV93DRAFT_521037 [Ceratobasidium sp. AG-I]|nr:hypothetical protein BDV93DRAFT_521037 [Ceratobasidium sp. AG-I]